VGGSKNINKNRKRRRINKNKHERL